MKYLGRGWQYTTYDLGNGRVFKKHNSRFVSYLKMIKDCFPYTQYPIWKFSEYYNSVMKEARDSILKIQKTNLDQSIFGNPRIDLNGIDYEQDSVIPLHKFFKNSSFADSKKIIDKFIDLNLILIQNRLIDKSFAIAKNFGLNKGGEVILIDIGELWSDPEKINKQIRNRVWIKRYIVKTFPDKSIRDYFIVQMDERINEIDA